MRDINCIIKIIFILLISNISFASNGGRGGGDPCENRILSIADDIQAWIEKGGAKDLKLPSSVRIEDYESSMIEQIQKAQVRCVSNGDQGYPVEINGTAKVCRFDLSDKLSQITCDLNKFESLNESEQYTLLHHEYAGLSGIENPNGAASTYTVSNQISAYLEDTTVKKLAILPKTNTSAFSDLLLQFNKGKHLSYSQAKGFFSGRCFRSDQPNTPIASMLAYLSQGSNNMGPGFPSTYKITSFEKEIPSPATYYRPDFYDDLNKFAENKEDVLTILYSDWNVIGWPQDTQTLTYEMDWLPFGSPDEKVELALGETGFLIAKWTALTLHTSSVPGTLPIQYGYKSPGELLQMCYYFKKLGD